jgi:hypothetical protein
MHLVTEEVFPRLGEPIERRPLTGRMMTGQMTTGQNV